VRAEVSGGRDRHLDRAEGLNVKVRKSNLTFAGGGNAGRSGPEAGNRAGRQCRESARNRSEGLKRHGKTGNRGSGRLPLDGGGGLMQATPLRRRPYHPENRGVSTNRRLRNSARTGRLGRTEGREAILLLDMPFGNKGSLWNGLRSIHPMNSSINTLRSGRGHANTGTRFPCENRNITRVKTARRRVGPLKIVRFDTHADV